MKRWLKYIRPYLKYFILGPLCMIVEVLGEVFMPKLLASIINQGVGSSENVGNGTLYILTLCLLMIVTAALMLLGGVGGAYFGAKASVNFGADLRADLYDKVGKFSFANVDKFSTGSLVTRLTNDVTQIQNFINALLRICLRAPGMLIGGVIMAIVINPKLAVILAVSVPLVMLVQAFIIQKGFHRFSTMQKKIDRLNTTVQENVTNVRVVKSFVREDFESEKFSCANSELKAAGLSAMNLMILMQPLMMLIMNATTLAVLWFGGNQVIDFVNGNLGMEIGDLTAFLTYINQILFSLMMVSFIFIMSSRAIASGKRIIEVLDEPLSLTDENAKNKDKTVEKGEITFQNVSFRYYKNNTEKVLDNINLHIPAGSTVGIIGSTGCGKSSLISLIPRLYDADEGAVLVDGVDVRDYSLKNLRDGVAVVLQKNVLFSGTVEDNLLWGDADATTEEITEATKASQADSFLSAFPDGYQTNLEQGGVNLSGGQKQRLCIARALLKKPKVLILDDSTSAVDTATESHIRTALRETLSQTTKIIIAQRILSVMEADIIVVMDDGKITGIGNHETLLRENETYKEICESQIEKKEDDH